MSATNPGAPDPDGHMLGIITADDVLDVSEQEATEEIQKIGGTEALDAPYLDVGYLRMVWKRGGWLSALFLGEMLTATAMGHYEGELAKAIVLTMFIPLIISSGGNSGSQAATLIVRSLALTELRLRDGGGSSPGSYVLGSLSGPGSASLGSCGSPSGRSWAGPITLTTTCWSR